MIIKTTKSKLTKSRPDFLLTETIKIRGISKPERKVIKNIKTTIDDDLNQIKKEISKHSRLAIKIKDLVDKHIKQKDIKINIKG